MCIQCALTLKWKKAVIVNENVSIVTRQLFSKANQPLDNFNVYAITAHR